MNFSCIIWERKQGLGIIPDVFITPTIEGIRAGRDEVLEKALQLVKN